MSRSKLFNMVKSRGENKQGRNAFDLSNKHVYSQKVAKIVPVKAIGTYPDDYLEVNVSEFTQNKVPMNRAAFLSGKKELLAYFVPYNSIWHNFNQYMATREDPDSVLLYDKGISYEPRMRLFDLYYAAFWFATGAFALDGFRKWDVLYFFLSYANDPDLFSLFYNGGSYDVMLDPRRTAYIRLEGSLDPNELLSWLQTTTFSDLRFTDVSPSLSLYDYCEDVFLRFSRGCKPRDNGVNLFGFPMDSYDDLRNISFRDAQCNVVGNFVWCDFIQKLDMLGYGNIYPLIVKFLNMFQQSIDNAFTPTFDVRFALSSDNIDSYIFYNGMYVLSQGFPQYDYYQWSPFWSYYENVSFEPLIAHWRDIYNMFISELQRLTEHVVDGQEVYEYVNVYPLFAYNRCFYDYMRNVYYDTDYNVRNYNCDYVNGKTLAGSIIEPDNLPLRWYHLEMHQWKKDMFTGVLPDNQLGQVSQVFLQGELETDTSSSYYPTSLSGSASFQSVNNRVELQDADGTSSSHQHYINVSENNTYFDVLALKRAEAIQRYRQDLMRAGNRTKDIFNQVFGITPKSELDESPYFIEVSSQDINVNPIISTAQTGDGSNQSLGDIAARVTLSGNDLHFKFSTKDFGCLLILSYIIPDSYYNSYRIDPFNMHLDQESHGLPYFQNLGLQPVIGSMLSNFGDSSQRSRILGYAPPYIEFKTDIDLVHGDFVDAYAAAGEDVPYDPYYEGEMSPWVVARTDMQLERAVSLRNFYVNPKVLDNVFTFQAGDDYSTDHFFTHSVIKVKAIRAFSELGLPHF